MLGFPAGSEGPQAFGGALVCSGEFECRGLGTGSPKDSSPHTLGSPLALHGELGAFRSTAPAPGSSRTGTDD